jgi:hypothetical protein
LHRAERHRQRRGNEAGQLAYEPGPREGTEHRSHVLNGSVSYPVGKRLTRGVNARA